ncbi:MAG: hypothetical protein GX662_12205 [Trichococcus flocculiformis]|uniref:Uncharacterized protein n=1 Tax=Trichococcus flocculiformis TaxID=82803 RepID=A0A847D8Y2_9LACT|nr:hypothetical protein [Trichococcus flocculiformis]NLD33000.1 hypothetical protein [Trichococcus flocculiformis]
MLYKVMQRFPQDVTCHEEGPLVSLYLPIHKSYPDKKSDPVVFRNLLRDVENSLRQEASTDWFKSMMKPLYELRDDTDFWNLDYEGIAVLASKNRCIVYHLHHPVMESAVVGRRYQIRPLLKAFQSIENYQLLGLSRESFSLYQSSLRGFEEIAISQGTPRTMEDVLGDQFSDPFSSHRSYSSSGGNTFNRGHGDVKQEMDKDTEKYFRYVDSFVWENYSKPSKMPLILVSLAEFHSEFRNISKNPYLLEPGIHKSIDSLTMDEIQKRAGKIIQTLNKEKTEKLANSYADAEGKFLGSSEFVQVTKAAFEGRVERILIEENKVVLGRIDDKTGGIEFDDKDGSGSEDVIDYLVSIVLSSGGKVIVLPKDEMPRSSGIAAFFRYD